MEKKLIVANWKMKPETLAQAQEILDTANDYLDSRGENHEISIVICPPFIFIEEVAKMLSRSHLEHNAFLGAQDISVEDNGAFTGEVSGPQLAKLGVQYVIVGHSERRWKLGETDDIVNAKIKAVIRNEMTPIVCLGERERSGDYQEFLRQQTANTFADMSEHEVEQCLISYEPVWAISTNPGAMPDNPESSVVSMKIIRDELSAKYRADGLKYLYGGSVTPNNVADFLSRSEIDGALVGGASVDKEKFVQILEQV